MPWWCWVIVILVGVVAIAGIIVGVFGGREMPFQKPPR